MTFQQKLMIISKTLKFGARERLNISKKSSEKSCLSPSSQKPQRPETRGVKSAPPYPRPTWQNPVPGRVNKVFLIPVQNYPFFCILKTKRWSHNFWTNFDKFGNSVPWCSRSYAFRVNAKMYGLLFESNNLPRCVFCILLLNMHWDP